MPINILFYEVIVLSLMMFSIILHVIFSALLVGLAIRYHKECGQFKILSAIFIVMLTFWGAYYTPDIFMFFNSNPREVSGTIEDISLAPYPKQLITNTFKASNNNALKIKIKTSDDEEIILYETRTEYLSSETEDYLKNHFKYLFKYYPQSKIITSFKSI